MIFAGIDVNIILHEKALNAGVEAMGLWMWGMCYAQANATDGRLPRVAIMSAWGADRRTIRRLCSSLVAAGLWHESGDGSYLIWNYGKKNQTADEIQSRKESGRQANAERQRLYRERMAARKEALRNASVTPVTRDDVTGLPLPLPLPLQIPLQRVNSATSPEAPPVASPTEPVTKVSSRGTRLPEGWKPSEATIAWAKTQGFSDPLAGVDEFADYWRAQPGSRGVKTDWDATYRNRLRQVGSRGSGRFVKGAEITKQPTDYDAPWMKLPEVSDG